MNPPRPSLLARLQRLIEYSYDWNTGIKDLGPFLVGDEGYRVFYQGREMEEPPPGSALPARTLVRCNGLQTRLGVYYPDSLVLHLEERNPLLGVDDGNVAAFAILVEELDHLLMLAWCARHKRGVGLLELEFHAYLTKYLVLAHFIARLSRRTRLTEEERVWLSLRLFNGEGDGLPVAVGRRYRTAARLAREFLLRLEALSGEERIRVLRRVARRSWDTVRSCLESSEAGGGLRLLLAV
jgi:hypothetical protein